MITHYLTKVVVTAHSLRIKAYMSKTFILFCLRPLSSIQPYKWWSPPVVIQWLVRVSPSLVPWVEGPLYNPPSPTSGRGREGHSWPAQQPSTLTLSTCQTLVSTAVRSSSPPVSLRGNTLQLLTTPLSSWVSATNNMSKCHACVCRRLFCFLKLLISFTQTIRM